MMRCDCICAQNITKRYKRSCELKCTSKMLRDKPFGTMLINVALIFGIGNETKKINNKNDSNGNG